MPDDLVVAISLGFTAGIVGCALVMGVVVLIAHGTTLLVRSVRSGSESQSTKRKG